jgi:hypothetical protein
MRAPYKKILPAVIVLIFAFAGFGQAPPEIKAKLDARILQPGNREQPLTSIKAWIRLRNG